MSKAPLIIALVPVLAMGSCTGSKLFKMCQIRGWAPGASAESRVITQKWLEPKKDGLDETYWIAWTEKSIREVGDHRTNVEDTQWKSLNIGDAIEIVRVPGDKWPHTRDGIFTSPGNFAFDLTFLALELVGAALIIRKLLRAAPSGGASSRTPSHR